MSLPLSLDTLLTALDADVDSLGIATLPPVTTCAAPCVEAVTMHHVLEGAVWLVRDGEPSIVVQAGGMIIMPAHASYSLQTAARPQWAIDQRDALVRTTSGERGEGGCRISWSTWRANAPVSTGALSGLHAPLVVPAAQGGFSTAALKALDEALSDQRAGSRTIAAALMKSLLALALRSDLDGDEGCFVLPATVQDRRLNRAATAVVDNPTAPHSVGSLASIAGMSRSAFAAEFKVATGTTPMHFVTRTRLATARKLLETSDLRIATVASLAGFIDRSYFSRAFRAHFGVDPSSYRRVGTAADGSSVDAIPAARLIVGAAAQETEGEQRF
ncbi:MAG: putative AraC family transcriptional regulator [Bradyrhizobium sp.]|nr:putative AraC family transcriptional regulator [Bradyrhizobium sp.]